jgi:hypothetical protein
MLNALPCLFPECDPELPALFRDNSEIGQGYLDFYHSLRVMNPPASAKKQYPASFVSKTKD